MSTALAVIPVPPLPAPLYQFRPRVASIRPAVARLTVVIPTGLAAASICPETANSRINGFRCEDFGSSGISCTR